jgi:thiopeptide-type bacteriocin biosynthesis protein
LLRQPTAPAPIQRRVPVYPDPPPSVFHVGSEWLYAKLYTGSATADRVLCEVIRDVAARALSTGAADRWFFLRYADPGWHLRFRLHGDPDRLWTDVFPDLRRRAAPLLADGRIAKLVLTTYERESDRYGGPDGIELAESIFQADSEAVIDLVAAHAGDEGAAARWRLALRGSDMLLDDLGLALADKHLLLRRLRQQFAARFHADVPLLREIGARFRVERPSLDEAFDDARAAHGPLAAGLAALRRRSERVTPLAAELRARERAGRLSQPLLGMAASYVHMYTNRLLRTEGQAQEVVLYDFLCRIYDSWAARKRPPAGE